MTIDWDDVVTPVNIPTSADEATKKRALGKPKVVIHQIGYHWLLQCIMLCSH